MVVLSTSLFAVAGGLAALGSSLGPFHARAPKFNPRAIALAWTIRSGNVIAIPESGSVAHVKENAVALSLSLTPEELLALDAAHPPPRR